MGKKKNAFIGKFGSQHPEFRYFGVIFGNICFSYRNYTNYIIYFSYLCNAKEMNVLILINQLFIIKYED